MNILRMRWPVTIVAVVAVVVGWANVVAGLAMASPATVGGGLVILIASLAIGTYAHGLGRDDD